MAKDNDYSCYKNDIVTALGKAEMYVVDLSKYEPYKEMGKGLRSLKSLVKHHSTKKLFSYM